MNTFQLVCFLTIAEHLNFTKAAELLNVTQPAVGQQIQSLEKELGVKLFSRTTRSVKLTKEGKSFLSDATQIVNISERAKKRFASTSTKEIEHLAIGCTNFPYMYQIIDVLEVLKKKRPEIHPEIQVIPFQHIYRMLDEGNLDAVIGFQEPASAKVSAQYRELQKNPMKMICASTNMLAQQKEVSLDELRQESLVVFDSPKIFSNIAQLQAKLMENRDISDLHFCSSAESIAVLVASGYGISVLPDVLIQENHRLVKVPIKDISPTSLGIYYKSLQGNPALKLFIDEARVIFSHEANSYT